MLRPFFVLILWFALGFWDWNTTNLPSTCPLPSTSNLLKSAAQSLKTQVILRDLTVLLLAHKICVLILWLGVRFLDRPPSTPPECPPLIFRCQLFHFSLSNSLFMSDLTSQTWFWCRILGQIYWSIPSGAGCGISRQLILKLCTLWQIFYCTLSAGRFICTTPFCDDLLWSCWHLG